MSGSSVPRRFLGRPQESPPGYLPKRSVAPSALPARATHTGRLWLVQAIAGGLLLVFLGIHLVAQHLLVPGGLRSYADVVAYLRQPIAFAAELGLLASVVVHAGLGVRSILVDVIRDPRRLARASWIIAAIGAAVFGYAVWLTLVIVGAI